MREIDLQKSGDAGVVRTLYQALKDWIVSGQLEPGEALPSTREYAKFLCVSRNTVCAAYDLLWSEGFMERRQGAPSRVAQGVRLLPAQKTANAPQAESRTQKPRWDFSTGQPDLAAFPRKLWNAALMEAASAISAQALAYGDPKGYQPLCSQIASWLLRTRSMEVNPANVFITSGSTQALYLLVDMLCRNGRAFALENPSHPGIRAMLADRGVAMQAIPVDEQGARVDTLDGGHLSAVYVTPSHQFPLGGILPAARRASLIRLALENDFYIIEDDYDSEYRLNGLPVSPMYTMDSSRVIYVGTFSKTMYPALRIGFAVLPQALQAQWLHSRRYLDVQNPVLEQAALAAFLQSRRMDAHIRRMRRLYGGKRALLLAAVRSAFGDAVIPQGDASGLHIALRFPGFAFTPTCIQNCLEAGVRVAPVSAYCASETEYSDTLLIGYGHLQPSEISDGIAALAKCIGGLPR